MYMIDIVIPIKDFYRNIPGQGKVKELTKGKQYECGIEKLGSTYFFILTSCTSVLLVSSF